MFRRLAASVVVLVTVAGCTVVPTDFLEWFANELAGAGPSVGDVAPSEISDPNDPAKQSAAAGEAIRVRLINPTPRDADCQLIMEVIGRNVHHAFRRILAATESLVIGPDQADIVRIEVTFLGQPPAAMAPRVLRINEDFNAGDTIEFVLELPPLLGACCFDTGACDLMTADECASGGGDFLGEGTECDPNPCVQPVREGACCFLDGTCGILAEADCSSAGGTYQGDDTVCDPNPCPQPGACCFGDGTCEVLTADQCASAEGSYQGDNTTCDPNPCPQPGACCFGDGACEVMFEAECAAVQGSYQGDNTTCDPNPCPQPGACCFSDGTCAVMFEAECISVQGTYQGDNTTCEPNLCPAVVCPASSLFSQAPPDPNDPNSFWSRRESEIDPNGFSSLRYENFYEISDPICDIHWWGFMLTMEPNEQLVDCNEPDPTFEIAFYQDSDGMPDPNGLVCSYTVTPTIVPTGQRLDGDTVYYFSVESLEPCCTIGTGWVLIRGGGSPDCRFYWLSSNEGDFYSYYEIGEFADIDEIDFSICLTP